MSGTYVVYPQTGGSGATTGSVSQSVFKMGTLDTFLGSTTGATIGTNTLYLQSATFNSVGLVNFVAQTYSGKKTFNNGIDLNAQQITSVADPVSTQDAATKIYVDTRTTTIGSISLTEAAGGTTYALTYPGVQGSNSHVLVNNGSGTLSWTPRTTSTNWVTSSFTTNLGTNSAATGVWRQDGPNLVVDAIITLTGAPGASANPVTLSLPTALAGISINSASMASASSGRDQRGTVKFTVIGGATVMGLASYDTTAAVRLATIGTSSTTLLSVTNTYPATIDSNTFMIVNYSVPIVGWSV